MDVCTMDVESGIANLCLSECFHTRSAFKRSGTSTLPNVPALLTSGYVPALLASGYVPALLTSGYVPALLTSGYVPALLTYILSSPRPLQNSNIQAPARRSAVATLQSHNLQIQNQRFTCTGQTSNYFKLLQTPNYFKLQTTSNYFKPQTTSNYFKLQYSVRGCLESENTYHY